MATRHLAEKRKENRMFFLYDREAVQTKPKRSAFFSFRKNIAIFSFEAGAGGSSFCYLFFLAIKKKK
jgi:hypothetical protein